MIQVDRSLDPLLKRPFSFLKKSRGEISFLYAIRGKGTLLMKEIGKGEVIDLIGPLGNGYPQPDKGYIPLVIAGGTGIASIFSLIQNLAKKTNILYGARKRNELLLIDSLKRLSNKLILCTDDGSVGEKCTVVDVMENFLGSTKANSHYIIYACGPKPMLGRLAKAALMKGIRGYVSLEENMACGFGACLGCAVKTVRGYKRVCKEGPVFPIEEIVWE